MTEKRETIRQCKHLTQRKQENGNQADLKQLHRHHANIIPIQPKLNDTLQ